MSGKYIWLVLDKHESSDYYMQIIPTKNISNTSISYIHNISNSSQLIYISTLLAVMIVFASLPFIYTTVSVKGQGLMQSDIEKIELLSPSNGLLVSMNLVDNKKVRKGEILFVLDSTLPNQQQRLLNNNAKDLQQKLEDATRAVGVMHLGLSGYPKLQTGLYQSSWQQYIVQFKHATNEIVQANRIYQRYQTLYDKQVVTQAEYEQYKFNYEQALSSQEMTARKFKNQWQAEASQYQNELRELQRQNVQLKDQEKQYILTATINGSVQNLTGLRAGAYVHANQKIGEISPDSSLLAYCYIKPSDIGLIKKQQKVRFQVDAFNYNQWGMLTG
ncbi:MAG: HlyD family efflux transporter periplasmic adaptor subunit, partial [Chitinophagaceae bacterium]